MKKVQLIITSMALMLTVLSASANSSPTSLANSKKELRTKIASLLGKQVAVNIEDGMDIVANISFMINSKNELIIISVDSKNSTVDACVKNKLNYKTVKVKGIKKGEVYEVPLKIKRS